MKKSLLSTAFYQPSCVSLADRLTPAERKQTIIDNLVLITGSNYPPGIGGRGLMITKDGFIITPRHVVRALSKLYVVTKTDTRYELAQGASTWLCAEKDLALIKVTAPAAREPIPFCLSERINASNDCTLYYLDGGAIRTQSVRIALSPALPAPLVQPHLFFTNIPEGRHGVSGGIFADEEGRLVGMLLGRDEICQKGQKPMNYCRGVRASHIKDFLADVEDGFTM